MAGYSGTPLPKKLGIKAGHRVALLGAPKGFEATLGELPAGTILRSSVRSGDALDVVVLFAKDKAALKTGFGAAKAALAADGGFWIAWPKKASGVSTDLTEDVIRADALAASLVDNKVCAIDETWSGLRLVYRVADRAAVANKAVTTKAKAAVEEVVAKATKTAKTARPTAKRRPPSR